MGLVFFGSVFRRNVIPANNEGKLYLSSLCSSSPNAYLLINVLNSKRILMKTKAFKENLQILAEKISADGKILSVQVRINLLS